MTDTTTPTAEATDWAALSAELEQTLRLRSIPFAMKMLSPPRTWWAHSAAPWWAWAAPRPTTGVQAGI